MNEKYMMLIELFNQYKDETIHAREIAAKTGYSPRSVLRFINIINSLDDSESFRIVSVKNKGFKLQVLDEKKYNEFYKNVFSQDYILDNQNDVLFALVLNDLSITKLEKELNYSQSSITRLINTLNEKLSNRNLEIERKNNTFSLVGNEIQIRNFGHYLWQLNNFEIEKLPKKYQKEFVKYQEYLKTNDVTDLPDIQSFLFISLVRACNDHEIHFSPILKEFFNSDINNRTIACVTKYYKDNYNKIISEDELIFISLMLSSDDGNYSFSENVNAIMPVMNKVLIGIDNKYGTNYENDDELLNAFCAHVSTNIPSYILMNKADNSLLNQIRLNFTNEHVYALEFANSLHELLGIVISDEDIGYLTLHFANCDAKKKRTANIETAIIYDQSLTAANLLAVKLKDLYPQLDITVKKVGEPVSKNCLRISYLTDDIKDTVRVSLFLNEEDKKTIDAAIIEKAGYEPFIKLCNASNFFIVDKGKSKNEFLQNATDELVNRKLLSKEEADSILDRENLSSTEIAMGVAFPHCTVSAKSFLSIYVFKQPIYWHSNYVRIVLLMGYNKRHVGIQNAIKYLFSNLSDSNKIERLANATNFDEFIQVLRGK